SWDMRCERVQSACSTSWTGLRSQRRAATSASSRTSSGRIHCERRHQRILVLSRAECVGCISYSIGARADVLLGSATVVDALVVGPVVAPGRISVVPLVLARIIIRCLDRTVDEIVVID